MKLDIDITLNEEQGEFFAGLIETLVKKHVRLEVRRQLKKELKK